MELKTDFVSGLKRQAYAMSQVNYMVVTKDYAKERIDEAWRKLKAGEDLSIAETIWLYKSSEEVETEEDVENTKEFMDWMGA